MKELISLIEDNEFKNFILTSYFSDQNMTDDDKLTEVCSSLHDYAKAMNCFKTYSLQAA